MISRSKKLFYLIEGVNSFASVYYSNYLFFYMQKQYGFGTLENLLLAALNGIVYTIGSIYGGKFAQKQGPVLSIGLGISGLLFSLLCGGLFQGVAVQIAVFVSWTFSICFIWPAIEAIVSDHEVENLSTMVGVYNMTWAGFAAFAYFTTGILLEKLGMQSIFWLPFGIHFLQLTILFPLAVKSLKKDKLTVSTITVSRITKRPEYSKNFLRMAWLSNPFSYVAINTIIPLMPSIAKHLGLSTGSTGVICSVWMFARLGTFFTLWKWSGWHYRLRWLAGAFALMISCYTAMLLAGSVLTILLAQIGFGFSIGIIYYSSLFYSMDASDEKGSHGGLHEAMIGSGLFLGPAFSAACLYVIPSAAKGVTGMSVNTLLLLGFTGLLWMGKFKLQAKRTDTEDKIQESEVPIS